MVDVRFTSTPPLATDSHMALSLETLNTTLSDRKDRQIMSFATATPFWTKLQEKAQVETLDSGTYIERPFSGGPPGSARRLDNGDEVFSTTRIANTQLLQVRTTRVAGAIAIPGLELDINDGKLGALKLIQRYPQAYLQALAQDIESWWLIASVQAAGNVISNSNAAGWVTLNGDYSSGVGTGLTDGVLDFAAPGSQTDSVFGLAKSESYAHYNQFGTSSGWSTDGMLKLRDLYRRCASFDPTGQGPDLIYADVDTYANFDFDRLAQVRTKMVEEKTERSTTLMLELGQRAELAYALYLDRAASTFVAGAPGPDDGVVYMLNTDFWELQWRREPSLSSFEDRTADQDVVIAKFLMDGNAICNKLTAQGALVGTAV